MTRFEKIKTMTVEELGRVLCDKMDDIKDHFPCIVCPFADLCKTGHNGIIAWLNEEVRDDE